MANHVVVLEARGREAAELCREEWFRAELLAFQVRTGSNPNCKPGGQLRKKNQVSRGIETSPFQGRKHVCIFD
jgi:hypothetical protein